MISVFYEPIFQGVSCFENWFNFVNMIVAYKRSETLNDKVPN